MKFIHKDNHSIIIEVLLFDLVRKFFTKKYNETVFWFNSCLLPEMKTIFNHKFP